MAQERFIKYLDPINSFEANEKYSGIIDSGVYKGFDTVTGVSNLNFNLSHGTTGEVFTKKNGIEQTDPRAIWTTKQGLVVKEDAPIALTLTANPNNYERWDLLVGVHLYDQLNPGGLPASYEILVGGDKTDPVLTTPLSQTILGRIKVPANATTASGIIWERSRVKGLGGTEVAILNQTNRFNGQLQENQATTSIITDGSLTKDLIQSLDGANSFLLVANTGYLDLLPNKPAGTVISITFDQPTVIRGFGNQLDGSNQVVGAALGYRAIVTDPSQMNYNLTVYAGDTVKFRKINTAWVHPTLPFGDYWVIESFTSSVTLRRLIDRDSIEYINPGPLGIRYTQTGPDEWTTDGLFKLKYGPNTPVVITLPPVLQGGNSAGLIEGKIMGMGLYNGATPYVPGQWPSDSHDKVIMEIQGIDFDLIHGWTPEANRDSRAIVFDFQIKIYKSIPYIIYRQGILYGFGGGSISRAHPRAESGEQGIDSTQTRYIPLPSLDLSQPMDIRFKAPLFATTLTGTEHTQWLDAQSDNRDLAWNALKTIEFKVIRL